MIEQSGMSKTLHAAWIGETKKKSRRELADISSPSYHGGGCFYDPSFITTGQVFLNEAFAGFVLLYLSFGVGLDPRQALLFGPRLGPALVGASLGLITFATSGIIPGYGGAQMNPARCFAFGIAQGDMTGTCVLV